MTPTNQMLEHSCSLIPESLYYGLVRLILVINQLNAQNLVL